MLQNTIKRLLISPAFKNVYRRHCSSYISSQQQQQLPQKEDTPTKTKTTTTTKIQPATATASITSYGQPTPQTHSHLLKPQELVQGIQADEFVMRRQRLMENIQKFSLNVNKEYKNHLVIIPSATKRYMSDKIPYVFRQNTDFMYLTGCLEMDTVLIMTIDEKQQILSTLFMRPKDKHAELWDGPRTGVENTPGLFKVDQAYPFSELKNFLIKYKKPYSLWYNLKTSELRSVNDILNETLKITGLRTIETPTKFIQNLRLIKSEAEIKLMRQTCEIASTAINETIRDSQSGDSEHEIFARVDFYCRMKGASFLAYPPVVAGGQNATTIHYVNNSQIVNGGEIVLMDAGCEFGGYTSDITRTWPIDGRFTEPQRILYQVIQTLQVELINTLQKDGGKTLDQLFDTMCSRLGVYLQEIGLIDKSLTDVDLVRAAFKFCPHHVSHYLGMDVHDTPLISRSLPLHPGMVCTVEPGIYIDHDRVDVPKEFRGIGIRIEDDILIGNNGENEILTKNCKKDLLEIEQLAGEMPKVLL